MPYETHSALGNVSVCIVLMSLSCSIFCQHFCTTFHTRNYKLMGKGFRNYRILYGTQFIISILHFLFEYLKQFDNNPVMNVIHSVDKSVSHCHFGHMIRKIQVINFDNHFRDDFTTRLLSKLKVWAENVICYELYIPIDTHNEVTCCNFDRSLGTICYHS